MDSFEYAGVTNLKIMAGATHYHKFLEELICRYVRKEDKVVDFGAGLGIFADTMAKKGAAVMCVEIDQQFCWELRQKGFEVKENLRDCKEDSQDVIYAFDVLEHIENEKETIRSWYAALRLYGIALVYVPAFQVLFSDMDRKIGHFRRYRKEELRQKLQAEGFEVQRIEYVDCIGFLGGLFYKWTSRSDGELNPRMVYF